MQLENTKVQIKIFGDDDLIIENAYIEYSVSKDLEKEPNTCQLKVWNLNDDYVHKIKAAAEDDAPVELYLQRGGIKDANKLILAFVGEINNTFHEKMRPGNVTTINCSSQKINHRDFFVEGSYKKDTDQKTILTAFIDAINLPAGNEYDLPDGKIKHSESFSGPAFNLLARYCSDLGLIAYILDGKLFISSIYEPPRLQALVITDDIVLSKPESMTFEDKKLIGKKAIAENHTKNPFRDTKKRRRRRKKKKKILGKNYHVEYEAIDMTIHGMACTLYTSASIQPDDIVKYGDDIYRVRNVMHEGDNEGGGFDTMIEAEDYNHYLVYAPKMEEVKA